MKNKYIICLILIIGIIIVGCTSIEKQECPEIICLEQEVCLECEECQVCKQSQIPIGKSMLDINMYTWGINELDNNEILFQYWIYNYGDTESKNIRVRCKLSDDNNKVLVSIIDNYGNLASISAEFGEVITKKPLSVSMTKEYVGYCYVESCSNCEILYKRIPKLVESYEAI